MGRPRRARRALISSPARGNSRSADSATQEGRAPLPQGRVHSLSSGRQHMSRARSGRLEGRGLAGCRTLCADLRAGMRTFAGMRSAHATASPSPSSTHSCRAGLAHSARRSEDRDHVRMRQTVLIHEVSDQFRGAGGRRGHMVSHRRRSACLRRSRAMSAGSAESHSDPRGRERGESASRSITIRVASITRYPHQPVILGMPSEESNGQGSRPVVKRATNRSRSLDGEHNPAALRMLAFWVRRLHIFWIAPIGADNDVEQASYCGPRGFDSLVAGVIGEIDFDHARADDNHASMMAWNPKMETGRGGPMQSVVGA